MASKSRPTWAVNSLNLFSTVSGISSIVLDLPKTTTPASAAAKLSEHQK